MSEVSVYKKYAAVLKLGERFKQPKINDTCYGFLKTAHHRLFMRPNHNRIHGEIFEI